MYSALNTLSEYTYFYISKNIISVTFLLVFKIVESLQFIHKANNSVYIARPYLPIFLTVYNNISMKTVIKIVKSVESINFTLLNQLNVL